MFNLGPWEVGLILIVALIVVGPGKLPEVARSIGKGINEFKKATNGYKKEFQEALNEMERTVTDEKKPATEQKSSVEDVAQKFDSVVHETSGSAESDQTNQP
jgi:TatA/E family protein of Tat protein translocase